MREISLEEFGETKWNDPNERSNIQKQCEQNLTVLGCTGLEDQLQDGVAGCIQEFKEAGIKVWMLTGDSADTAKTIGYDCGILYRDETKYDVIQLDGIDQNQL